MALTDTAIRNAKPREKPFKLGDGGGLFLLVQPSGSKLWRLKYRISGKEKKLAIGPYPAITLIDARKRRDAARELMLAGKDPSREKQRAKARAAVETGNTFRLIAGEYCDHRKNDGQKPWAPRTQQKADFLLAQLLPDLGDLPIGEIEPADILAAVRKAERKGNHETAKRALQMSSAIFRYAVSTARLKSDPTRDLRSALGAPAVKHFAAILDPVKFGGLLRAIDEYDGHISTRLALQLAPLVFVRPGELRHAKWEHVDVEAAVWSIPAELTKMRKPHHVPISRQASEIFAAAKRLTEREAGYVFPSIRSSARPMSENTLNGALRRLGYSKDEMTSHGFRATASTLLNESGKWSPDAIERALAHGDADQVRAAYNRGAYWQERVAMAQWWADYLDTLREGGKVLPFSGKRSQELGS